MMKTLRFPRRYGLMTVIRRDRHDPARNIYQKGKGACGMIVMLLEKVPLRLRGELTRWLIEPRTGVFVGHVNAMVRDRLWQKCCNARGMGGVVQVWSTN